MDDSTRVENSRLEPTGTRLDIKKTHFGVTLRPKPGSCSERRLFERRQTQKQKEKDLPLWYGMIIGLEHAGDVDHSAESASYSDQEESMDCPRSDSSLSILLFNPSNIEEGTTYSNSNS